MVFRSVQVSDFQQLLYNTSNDYVRARISISLSLSLSRVRSVSLGFARALCVCVCLSFSLDRRLAHGLSRPSLSLRLSSPCAFPDLVFQSDGVFIIKPIAIKRWNTIDQLFSNCWLYLLLLSLLLSFLRVVFQR